MEGEIKKARAEKNHLRKTIVQLEDELLVDIEQEQPHKEEVIARYQEIINLLASYDQAVVSVQTVLLAYSDNERSLATTREKERVAILVQETGIKVQDYCTNWKDPEQTVLHKNETDETGTLKHRDDEQDSEFEHQVDDEMERRLYEAQEEIDALRMELEHTRYVHGQSVQRQKELESEIPEPKTQVKQHFKPELYSTPNGIQSNHLTRRFHKLQMKDDHETDQVHMEITTKRNPPPHPENREHQNPVNKNPDVRQRDQPALINPSEWLDNDQRQMSAHAQAFTPVKKEAKFDPNCSLRQQEYREPMGYQAHRQQDYKHINPLARMDVPVFGGDMHDFESWWREFVGMVHTSNVPTHFKMMRLRRALTGIPKRMVDGMTDSEFSYDLALDALWEKYGGQRRQLGIRYDDLSKLKPVQEGSGRDLDRLVEVMNVLIVRLKEAGQDNQLDDGLLYSTIQRKLPESMLARYFQWMSDNSYKESVITIRKFVSREAGNAARAEEASRGFRVEKERNLRSHSAKTLVVTTPQGGASAGGGPRRQENKCRMCDEGHGVWRCPQFIALSVSGRWAKAQEHRLCFRCLSTQHRGETCSFSRKCGIGGCQNTHHRMLHDDKGKRVHGGPQGGASPRAGGVHVPPPVVTPSHTARPSSGGRERSGGTPAADAGTQQRSHTAFNDRAEQVGRFVALRTVPVIIKYGERSIRVNALLDDASTKSYINADIARALNMEEEPAELSVNTLNNSRTRLKSSTVAFTVASVKGDFALDVCAYTTTRVTGNMKAVNWGKLKHQWSHLSGVQFDTGGQRQIVDILIGGDAGECHRIREERYGAPGEPVARLTPLGWTCVGTIDAPMQDMTNFTFCTGDDHVLARQLERHWAVEDPPACSVVTPGDRHAIMIAENTLSYADGRYTLGVPWKLTAAEPVLNYDMALKRLCQTEMRLRKCDVTATMYRKVIQDYTEKGYIREVTDARQLRDTKWLLAHFAVVKMDRATTKLRVVFDGAAKHLGVSLNDLMLTGPKMQADLVHVLSRFRKYAIGIACDIQEMYLQIGLKEEDRPYHRFLWRELEDGRKAKVFEFLRWVFGNRASPFGAHYVSKKNAERHREKFPLAARTVEDSTYMDDSMDSVSEVKGGHELYKQLVQLWALAHMKARKWISNSKELLKLIPNSELNACVDLDRDTLPQLKTLGVMWDSDKDVFLCKVSTDGAMPGTKRQLLSKTATLFDPMGFFCPVTVIARILLQQVWMAGLDWDEALTETLQGGVNRWCESLPGLENLHIPRACQREEKPADTQIHVFTDASLDAYGAVAYVRQRYINGEIDVCMLLAKVKVAPTAAVSVPRLELMAAMVGLQLTAKLKRVYDDSLVRYRYWSDSADVLYWIRGQSRRFKPFVSNRVGQIQRESEPSEWRHVSTHENPADILSRGMPVEELCASHLWLEGPPYLKLDEKLWPAGMSEFNSAEVHEEKAVKAFMTSASDVTKPGRGRAPIMIDTRLDPARYSSVERYLHIVAYVMRFMYNSRQAKQHRRLGALSPDDVSDAETLILRHAQAEGFKDEVTALKHDDTVKVKSCLAGMNPWMDNDGVVRMDSRLKHASGLSWNAKHPVLLPRSGAVTMLYVRRAHEDTGHGGTNKTLADLTSRFWVISAREAIRSWEKKCMACRRRKAIPQEQLMAPLPADRISVPKRPFEHTTLDFAGPFLTKQGRGRARSKRYMCIFTCMATRAVHIELVYSMETGAFLNAFTRMSDRRGCPTCVTSDNGTNFVGADNELRKLAADLDRDTIQHKTAVQGVAWQFNPPAAPHFNGVHEALVKSAKRAVRNVLTKAEFTDEELHTAFSGAEKMLNSRPLTYQSANPMDLLPLTPAQFLVGHVEVEFPPHAVDVTSHSVSNRWRYVQEVLRHLWQRWMKELLPLLGLRAKWRRVRPDTKVGDVVLMVTPDGPRSQWPLAMVTATYPGKDGLVRTVDLKTKSGTYRRPIVKTCALEIPDSDC